MALFTGGRPKPSPVVRLFSFLVAREAVEIRIHHQGRSWVHSADSPSAAIGPALPAVRPVPPSRRQSASDTTILVPLRRLAWGRSGDKGDRANIGIIARDERYVPYLWEQLTEAVVAARFRHFLKGPVERWYLPGTHALNFLLHDVLGGGGVASLRADAQGKGYAQVLLDTPIEVPSSLIDGALP